MGWMDRLDALDDAWAVWTYRVRGPDRSTQPDYRFDIDDRIVLRVPLGRRRTGLVVTVVLAVALLVVVAALGQVLLVAVMLPHAIIRQPSALFSHIELDAVGVTWRHVWFLRPVHTPWGEVDQVVTGPWPAMRPPHVRRPSWPRLVPLRGRQLEAIGGDPVTYAVEMARRHQVEVIDVP